MFFEIYKSNQPTFKSSEQNTTEVPREIINLDTTVTNLVVTNWSRENSIDDIEMIQLFPNPTSDIINLKIYSEDLIGFKWQLLNTLGEEIKTGIIESLNLSIDLAGYAGGIYHFKLISNNVAYEYKIIKV